MNSSTQTVLHNEFSKKQETYEVLAEFPFDSDRKRMSVIVKYENKHILMTKGADNVMIPRCALGDEELVNIQVEILNYARDGLRTLVIAQKEL
jgi:P-type E1-E2 ATPase